MRTLRHRLALCLGILTGFLGRAIVCPQPAYAVTAPTTVVTLQSILANGSPIAYGKLCAMAVDANDNPIAYTSQGWGVITAGNQFCANIVNGAISGGLSLPDANLTDEAVPINYSFTVQLTSSTGMPLASPIQLFNSVGGVTGATFPLDNYASPSTGTTTALSNLIGYGSSVPATCTSPSIWTVPASTTVLTCLNGIYQPVINIASLVPQGNWNASTAYTAGNVVYYLGSSYVRLIAGTTPSTPAADTANWSPLALQGPAGPSPAFDTRPLSVSECKQCAASNLLLSQSGSGAVEDINLIFNNEPGLNENTVFLSFLLDNRSIGPVSLATFCNMNGASDSTSLSVPSQFILTDTLAAYSNGGGTNSQITCRRKLHIPYKYGIVITTSAPAGATAWWNVHYRVGSDPVGLYPATRTAWNMVFSEPLSTTLTGPANIFGTTTAGSPTFTVTSCQTFAPIYPGEVYTTNQAYAYPGGTTITAVNLDATGCAGSLTMSANAAFTSGTGTAFMVPVSELAMLPTITGPGELESLYLQLQSRDGSTTGSLESPFSMIVDGALVTGSGLEDQFCSSFYFSLKGEYAQCGAGRVGAGVVIADGSFTGTTTVGSNIITGVSSIPGTVTVGDHLTGTGIGATAQVAIGGLSTSGQVTMTQKATASGTVTITATDNTYYYDMYRNYGLTLGSTYHLPFASSLSITWDNGKLTYSPGNASTLTAGSAVSYYTQNAPALTAPAGSTIVGQWDAASLSGLANGAPIASWADQSATGLNLSSVSGFNNPTYVTSDPILSGKPSVFFNGCSLLRNTTTAIPFTSNAASRTLIIIGYFSTFFVVSGDSLPVMLGTYPTPNTVMFAKVHGTTSTTGGSIFASGGALGSTAPGTLSANTASVMEWAWSNSSATPPRLGINGTIQTYGNTSTPPGGGPTVYMTVGESDGSVVNTGQCSNMHIAYMELIDGTPNDAGGLAYYVNQALAVGGGYGVTLTGQQF